MTIFGDLMMTCICEPSETMFATIITTIHSKSSNIEKITCYNPPLIRCMADKRFLVCVKIITSFNNLNNGQIHPCIIILHIETQPIPGQIIFWKMIFNICPQILTSYLFGEKENRVWALNINTHPQYVLLPCITDAILQTDLVLHNTCVTRAICGREIKSRINIYVPLTMSDFWCNCESTKVTLLDLPYVFPHSLS